MKDSTFIFHPEHSDMRQGDIIRLSFSEAEGPPRIEYGVIITADCDIAQHKMGRYFTYLAIISVADYLEAYWAREQLATKQLLALDKAIKRILKHHRIIDKNAEPMPEKDLIDWLKNDSIESISLALNVKNKKDIDALHKDLNICLLTIVDNESSKKTNLQNLFEVWGVDGKSSKNQMEAINKALGNMRDGFFLIPPVD